MSDTQATIAKFGKSSAASDASMPAGATRTLLGTGRTIAWERSGSGFVAHMPAGLAPPAAEAWVLRVR
jgi:hypothetical protein